MAANAPEVQILHDSGFQTAIKVTGYYTGASTANVAILNPKTLAFANTQQTCTLRLTGVEYSVGTSGYVQLAWEGASSNTVIYTFPKTTAGVISGTVENTATNPTGNLTLTTVAVAANEGYSFVISFDKVQGFANAVNNAYGAPEAGITTRTLVDR